MVKAQKKKSISSKMVGRKVRVGGKEGEIVVWEPLGSALCDAKVRFYDGQEIWYASHTLRSTDGLGKLPKRNAEKERARIEALQRLRIIRKRPIKEWNQTWPGLEHGKGFVGIALDNAISSLKNEDI